jgi:hypothetical protein
VLFEELMDDVAPASRTYSWYVLAMLALDVFGALAYWRASRSYAAELAAAG